MHLLQEQRLRSVFTKHFSAHDEEKNGTSFHWKPFPISAEQIKFLVLKTVDENFE